MLISDIITEAMNEVGADTNDTALTTKFLGFTKSALRHFPLYSRDRSLTDTSYCTLPGGDSSITPLPSDFIEETAVYRYSDGAKIIIEKNKDFNSFVNTNSSGSPDFYRIRNNVIEFDKSADVTYVIYIEYYKSVDNVLTTSTLYFNTSMVEVLKEGIKSYYFSYTEDQTMEMAKRAFFKAGLDELEAEYYAAESPTHIDEQAI